MLDMARVLVELSKRRPVFHSEADFQHALAWELQRTDEALDVRLEYRPFPEESKSLDVLVRGTDSVTAIELKHLTGALDITVGNERFVLKKQGAYDIVSYDCIKDLTRLEQFLDREVADVGYLIVLANDSAHWRKPKRRGAAYDDFRLTDGRAIAGTLGWGSTAGPGTRRGREAALTLRGEYFLQWSDYSTVAPGRGGKFRFVAVEVSEGGSVKETPEVDMSKAESTLDGSAIAPMLVAERGQLMGRPKRTTWTIDDLREDLRRFEDELVDAKLKPSTVETYVQRSGIFLRWLDGKYEPSGPLA
jgi:hypothetical protein